MTLYEAFSFQTGRSREAGGHFNSKEKHQDDGIIDVSEARKHENTTYMAVSEQRYEVVRGGAVENSALVTGFDNFPPGNMT